MTMPMLASGNYIRLLHIESDETNSKQLYGSLKIVDLDNPPPFAALSYVCGTHSFPVDTIICDDHDLKITANCWSALWHLRKVVGTLDIWVDAVCIDQDDDADKVRQIPLMGEIYAKANPAYLWLGDKTESSHRVMDYLEVAGFQKWIWSPDGIELSVSEWRLALQSFLIRLRFWSKEISSTMVEEPIISISLETNRISSSELWSFLRTEWMTRIWTLQEAVLASRPVVCCGERLLPWRSLVISIVYLEYINRIYAFPTPTDVWQKWRSLIGLWLSLHHDSHHTGSLTQPEHTKDLLDHEYVNVYIRCIRKIHRCYAVYRIVLGIVTILVLTSLMAAAILFRKWTSNANRGLDVLSFFLLWYTVAMLAGAMIYMYRKILPRRTRDRLRLSSVQLAVLNEVFSRNTSEPCDKYLGLYSVLRHLGVRSKAPEGSMSQAEVYRELFLGLVQWGVGLDLILCASTYEDQNISSWVPDFSVRLEARPKHYRTLISKTILGDNPPYQATSILAIQHRRNLIEPIQLSFGHGILVYARPVTTIIWRCLKFDGNPETRAQNLCHLLQKVLELKSQAPSQQQFQRLRKVRRPRPIYKVEWRNIDNGPEVGTSYKSKTRIHHMGHIDDQLGPWTKPLWDATHFNPRTVDQEFSTELGREFSPLSNGFIGYQTTSDTTLFVTTNGLIGAGLDTILVNDSVFLVRGVSMPLILRSYGEFYRLVGFAEIEGMMDGEFWPDDNIETMQRITIV